MKIALKFLPLLILYVINILVFSTDDLFRDEPRYLMQAENLTKGFFANPDNPSLLNGPGYPLFLAIFVGLQLPLIVAKLANGVLIFFSVIFFFKTLLFYVPQRTALIFSYALGLYYPMFRWIILIITEALTLFLLCAFIYYLIKLIRAEKITVKILLPPIFFLGYLILTKLIFTYILIACLGAVALYYLIFRTSKGLKVAMVIGFSFIMLVPYLIYTYNLTGRTFYLGTHGGEPLYWMSTRHENEYGMWYAFGEGLMEKIPNIHPDHASFIREVVSKSYVEQNDLITKKAIENIKNNPKDYISNLIPSALRLLFGYPYSHENQNLSMYYYLFINIIIVFLFLFTLYPAWLNRKNIPIELTFLLLMALVYFVLHVMLVTVPRYFLLVIPILLLWSAYISSHFIHLNFKKLNNHTS